MRRNCEEETRKKGDLEGMGERTEDEEKEGKKNLRWRDQRLAVDMPRQQERYSVKAAKGGVMGWGIAVWMGKAEQHRPGHPCPPHVLFLRVRRRMWVEVKVWWRWRRT
jgi:hypothetical protein